MSEAKSTEIRGNRPAARLGTVIGWAMRIWGKTLRYEVDDRCGITSGLAGQPPVIYMLWHNRIFIFPPIWWRTGGNNRKSVVLTSASKDGAILSSAMEVFGLGAVRGSSSRRAVAALIGMKRALKEGLDVCITPDGPRGPRYSFHPGVIKLAESSSAAIVPIHAHCASAWTLKTWDGLIIPKPFSRVTLIFDTKLVVGPRLSEDEFSQEIDRAKSCLLAHCPVAPPLS